MSQMQLLVMCSLVVLGTAIQQGSEVKAAANPIRKVVTMLQNMQKKVEEEGEAEKKIVRKIYVLL